MRTNQVTSWTDSQSEHSLDDSRLISHNLGFQHSELVLVWGESFRKMLFYRYYILCKLSVSYNQLELDPRTDGLLVNLINPELNNNEVGYRPGI